MKIQLDTDNKIIRLDERVNLREFIKLLEGILPNGIWKEFTLETNIVINWTHPMIVFNTNTPYQNPWWNQPQIMYDSDTGIKYELNGGNYNIQL
jgi:hypothetical protein